MQESKKHPLQDRATSVDEAPVESKGATTVGVEGSRAVFHPNKDLLAQVNAL